MRPIYKYGKPNWVKYFFLDIIQKKPRFRIFKKNNTIIVMARNARAQRVLFGFPFYAIHQDSHWYYTDLERVDSLKALIQ